MDVRIETSKLVKPSYGLSEYPSPTIEYIPLSPFDRVTDDAHMAILYAYRPPSPPNHVIQTALSKALGIYREWAGRLGEDEQGKPCIILNDEGVRFVEAFVDNTHDNVMNPDKPCSAWLRLHPNTDGVPELLQIQLTRFTCGTVIIGLTLYHRVADGPATARLLVDWSRLCRNLAPLPGPLRDRRVFFQPRNPKKVTHNHYGVELTSEKPDTNENKIKDRVVTEKVHFGKADLDMLKLTVSSSSVGRYTMFEMVVAHLWKAMTKARDLPEDVKTSVKISTNGRARMVPRVPNEYFGNVILWAYPQARVKDLISKPLRQVVELIHHAISKVDDSYFKSFIDFANTKEAENMVPTVDPEQWVLSPNMDVDCWLRFPVRDMNFGSGSPFYFIPSYYPVEGLLFLVNPCAEHDPRSVDAYVSLFEADMATFKKLCYVFEHEKEGYGYGRDQQKEVPFARL